MSVYHCDNPQGLFVRRIGNQIFVNDDKSQRARGQVRASMALMRERHQRSDGVKDFRYEPISSIEIVVANEFPDLVKVKAGLWMEIIPGYEPDADQRRSFRGSRPRPRRLGSA
jgi:hypothetical protein